MDNFECDQLGCFQNAIVFRGHFLATLLIIVESPIIYYTMNTILLVQAFNETVPE